MSLDLLNKPCVKKCSLRKQFCHLRLIGAKARLPVWHADVDGANRGPIWSDETLPRKTSWILFSKHTKTQKSQILSHLVRCAAHAASEPHDNVSPRRAEISSKTCPADVLPKHVRAHLAELRCVSNILEHGC
jgi:hypothetical protein